MNKNIFAVLRLIAFFFLVPLSMQSQERFSWPKESEDLDRYTYWERCHALMVRASDSISARESIWKDTLHYSVAYDNSEETNKLANLASRCLSYVRDKEALSVDAINIHPLLILGGQLELAANLIDKKISALDTTSRHAAAYIIDSAIRNLTNSKTPPPFSKSPQPRFQEAITLYQKLLGLGEAAPVFTVISSIGSILNAARKVDDGEMITFGLEQVADLARHVSEDDWSGRAGLELSILYSANLLLTKIEEFLDSLAVSNHAYNSLRRFKFDSAIGRRDISPVGSSLEGREILVTGHFWFPDAASNSPPPRRGEVTLVVPFDRFALSNYESRFAQIRRLSKKFPELKIVVLAKTLGHFFDQVPPEPAEEARLLDSLRRFYKLPGVFAVEETAYWRLPEPDRRRINSPTANEENNITKGIIVVDKEGREVFTVNTHEKALELMIPVLLNRPLTK